MEPRTDVVVKLSEHDGNAFAVLRTVTNALREAGYPQLAQECFDKATSGDFDHLLEVIQSFVTVEWDGANRCQEKNTMSGAEQMPDVSQYEDELDDVMQNIVDAVASYGAETVIKGLSDACYIAAAAHEELKDWSRMSELLQYAKNLEEMPLHRK